MSSWGSEDKRSREHSVASQSPDTYSIIGCLLSSFTQSAIRVVKYCHITLYRHFRRSSSHGTPDNCNKKPRRRNFFSQNFFTAPMQPGKRSTTSRWKRLSCPSASFLILVFSIAVIVASLAVLLLIDVATPPLSNVFLSRKQFPQGQHLRIKSRRVTKIGASCDGFGVRRELFFHKFGGLQCALISWQSADEYEEEDRYIAKVETVYKVFGDNASAGEYFTKFWGTHMYDPLPPYLYVRKGAEAPRAGQQQRAFRWDSTNVRPGMPVPLQAVSTPPHVIFLFQ